MSDASTTGDGRPLGFVVVSAIAPRSCYSSGAVNRAVPSTKASLTAWIAPYVQTCRTLFIFSFHKTGVLLDMRTDNVENNMGSLNADTCELPELGVAKIYNLSGVCLIHGNILLHFIN